MKSIRSKFLPLIAIILISLFSNINTKTKKVSLYAKAKTIDYGSGDMTTGFKCPFIELYNNENGEKISTTGKWSFKPSDFTENLGFILTLEETDRNLNKYLKVHNKDTVYIPWRYFNDAFYNKKTASYKVLEVVLRNDMEEKIKAKFNLPWKFIGNIITQKDVNEVIAMIEKYRSIQRNRINKHKTKVEDLSDELFKSKHALKTQTLNAKAFKEKTEKSIRTNNAKLTQKRKEMEELDRKILLIKRQFYLMEENYVDIRDTLSMLQKKNENNLMLIDDNLRKNLYSEVDRNIVNKKDLIKADLHELANECKNRNLKRIEMAAYRGDSKSVANFLQAIKPINN